MFRGGFGYCSKCQPRLYDTYQKEVSDHKVGEMKLIVNKKMFLCKPCNETEKQKKKLSPTNLHKGLKKRTTGEKAFFDSIWASRPKRSFISGEKLKKFEGTDKYLSCFIHVLSKKQYKHYRLYDRNIVLGTPYEHYLIDQGTEEQRRMYEDERNISFAAFYELREELEKEYNQSFYSKGYFSK